MLAILFTPLYILVNYYIYRRSLKWMGACVKHFKALWFRSLYSVLFALFCTTPLTSYLITGSALHWILKYISNYWLGVFLYALLIIAVSDLVYLFLKLTGLVRREILNSRRVFAASGAVAAVCVLAVSLYGFLNAGHLQITSYEISVNKTYAVGTSLKVALVADLHLGYSIGAWHVENIVREVNAMDADIVCLAGDIFDNDLDAVAEPEKISHLLQSIQSRFGVYACWGNHDRETTLLAGFTLDADKEGGPSRQMEDFLTSSGVHLLNDEAILVDDSFYLIGRQDYSLAKHSASGIRKTPAELTQGLDLTKPVLVIDHQPKELQELADAGVDLDLSGHTHDGQLFPANLMVKLLWENAYGYLQKDNLHSIVTSGAGIYGPNMRVCTKSEIVQVTISFQP